jgi:hypothetical protein
MNKRFPAPIRIALVTGLALCVGLGATRADDQKKPVAAAPAKPAPKPAAAAPVVRQAPRQSPALGQAQAIQRDTQNRGAYAAGRTGFDGARGGTPPAVRVSPSTNQKSAAQIAKEQNAIPRVQPRKLAKPAEPPSPVPH